MSTNLKTGNHELSIVLGGSEQHEQIITLTEPDTKLEVRVTIDARDEDAPGCTLRVIHAAPNTHADVTIKTLAQQHAAPVVRGTLEIQQDASNCTSYLRHDSLVFDAAHVWTQPALEIKNNLVACSHSATIRTITPDDLFYMQTRGISTETAKETLINAFLA